MKQGKSFVVIKSLHLPHKNKHRFYTDRRSAAIATIDRSIEIYKPITSYNKLQPSIETKQNNTNAKGIDIGNAIDISNCKQR